jgi:4'-phosphopantetheinyl transferase
MAHAGHQGVANRSTPPGRPGQDDGRSKTDPVIAHDPQPMMAPLLDNLLIRPPLRLPGVLVYLLADRPATPLPAALDAMLDARDKARAQRYASPALGHRFLTGRAALRHLLSTAERGAVPETAWRFGVAANGKPRVQGPESAIVSFNLSYADAVIALALSTTLEIGVDIESVHPIPDDEIPWHLFSRAERRLLEAAAKEAFPAAFFRLWTLKEAIAKQTGQGMATEFSEINTLDHAPVDGLERLDPDADTADLLFHSLVTIEDQELHLAVSTAPIACKTTS